MKKPLLIILFVGFVQWWLTDPTITVPTNNIQFSYIIKYSADASRNDDLPMLVALHGNGDSAKNFYNSALDQFTVPSRIILIKAPLGSSWPWTAADFAQYGKAVNEAIALFLLEYPTIGKPILLGFSGGGMMAYYQALKYGDSYSFIFPISGKLSSGLLGSKTFRSGASVFAFHGKKDNVISISGGREAVNLLQTNGVDVHFTEFDGNHHGIFTDMKSEITKKVEQKLKTLR